ELQGLLKPGADPLRAVLHATLHAEARPTRWVAVAGPVAPGQGPATERGGEAFLQAREMIDRARRQRDGLLLASGDGAADHLLERRAAGVPPAMTASPVLTLAWLVLAHLVADFVIQTSGVANGKFGVGPPAWRALAWHVTGVAICMVPFVLAFGRPGLALLV